jgi:hypothetical protein
MASWHGLWKVFGRLVMYVQVFGHHVYLLSIGPDRQQVLPGRPCQPTCFLPVAFIHVLCTSKKGSNSNNNNMPTSLQLLMNNELQELRHHRSQADSASWTATGYLDPSFLDPNQDLDSCKDDNIQDYHEATHEVLPSPSPVALLGKVL